MSKADQLRRTLGERRPGVVLNDHYPIRFEKIVADQFGAKQRIIRKIEGRIGVNQVILRLGASQCGKVIGQPETPDLGA